MKKKRFLIEIVVVCLLLAVIVPGCYRVLRYKNVGSGGGMDNFYNTRVPIDVVIFGSSHAACTVNNAMLWEDNGIASYSLTAGSQGGDGTAYFVKEAIAVNKPKVALVETYLFGGEGFSLDAYYRSALTTRFSKRYLDYTMNVVKKSNLGREMLENMVLRMPVVHSRYKELSPGDFKTQDEYIRGYRGSNEIVSFDAPGLIDTRAELGEQVYTNIDDIIDSCTAAGVEPVLFAAPFVAGEDDQARQNSIRDYVESRGCRYIDFIRNYDDIGIDFSCDLRDVGHLNDYGAAKVTRALEKILVSDYDVPDRRGSAGYELWDRHVRYLNDRKLRYSLQEKEELEEYLEELTDADGDQTMILSLNGNYRAQGDDLYLPYLTQLGVNADDYEKGGVWLIRSGEVLYYSEAAEEFKYYRELGDSDCDIYKSEADEFPHILVGDNDFSPECNGITIVLFDEVCEYAIDDMFVNIYDGTAVERIELDE